MRAALFFTIITAMAGAGCECYGADAGAGTINYQLTFSGSGESTTVSSIEVLNIQQDTTASLSGTDVLVLSNIPAGETQLPAKDNAQKIVQMQYNEGERLLIKGISGDFSRVMTIVPSQNQTVDFLFVACTDAENNHYSVVTIGTQTWMAENLRYLPSVGGKGSATIPCYWVTGYKGTSVTDAKATSNYATYGVLYNWPAVEQAPPPKGWHLPTKAEWTTLQTYLVANGFNCDGNTDKMTGDHPNTLDANGLGLALASSRGWKKLTDEDAAKVALKYPGRYSKVGAVGSNDYPEKRNATGFSALPTGNSGDMSGAAKSAYWWCAPDDKGGLSYRGMQHYMREVYSNGGGAFRGTGFAIRCIKD